MVKLSVIRKKYKLSGYKVAKLAGVDRSYYRKVELNLYVPSLEVATKIEKAINKLTGKELVTGNQIVLANANRRLKEKRRLKAMKQPVAA